MAKKILVITSTFLKFDNDSNGWFIYELNKRLRSFGFETMVLAPHNKSLKFRQSFGDIRVCRFPYFLPLSCQKLAYGPGISENVKSHLISRIQIPFFIFSEFTCAAYLILKNRIRLVHTHWLIPQGFVGALCRKIFGVRHISTIHSSEITLIKKLPFGRRISAFIINNTDTIVSVSSHRAEELLDFVPPGVARSARDRLVIVPLGINANEYINHGNTSGLREKYRIKSKYVILFVGRLVEVKGCEYLIRALDPVVRKVDDVQLIIVGTGPLENELKRLVKEIGIEDHVRFEGYVDHRLISEYYSLSDVVAFTSIVDSSGFQEGLPLVLLEILASGKPVIATKVSGVLEVIKDGWNGILVDQKSSGQIADRLLELLENGELRSSLSRNAADTMRAYTWDSVASRYAQILDDADKDSSTRSII